MVNIQMAAQRLQELSLQLEQCSTHGAMDSLVNTMIEMVGQIERVNGNLLNIDSDSAKQIAEMVLDGMESVQKKAGESRTSDEPSPAAKAEFGGKVKSNTAKGGRK